MKRSNKFKTSTQATRMFIKESKTRVLKARCLKAVITVKRKWAIVLLKVMQKIPQGERTKPSKQKRDAAKRRLNKQPETDQKNQYVTRVNKRNELDDQDNKHRTSNILRRPIF